MGRIQEQGINNQIKKLEVVCRGFGAGREAVTKALLGSEGRLLRGKVIRVTDATRLKFGGTRSPKPRRLG
jgi:small subunit ribosomal protein S11